MFGGQPLLLVLTIALIAMQVWVIIRLARTRTEELPQLKENLDDLRDRLADSFTRANADMAARVEQIKGDLRIDLTERLQEGLHAVQKTVDDRLSEARTRQESLAREGRAELNTRLAETTQLLQSRFESLESRVAQNLDAIRSRVDERLQSISDQVQQKLEKNIQEGFAHFQKVQEHLKAAEDQLRNVGAVGQSINELNNLLKLPHLRGKFGEAELGRLLADFLPAELYEEQANIVPGTMEAVDAIVKFPNAKLPIDSKFNREQILPLFETSDPQKLAEARKQLATVIKQQAKKISEKYIHPEHGTTDQALIFLPSETIYFEVIRDVDLCETLHKLKVFPVSPNTLAITLKSIENGFKFYEFSKNVEKTIEQIRMAQAHFANFQKKFDDVGKNLGKAQEAFSTAAGHLTHYAGRVVRLTGEPMPELPEGNPNPPAVT